MYKFVKLPEIVVNKDNDRHGSVGSEEEAINWLIDNKFEHMKNLLEDVLKEKVVYEPPLLMKRDGSSKYTVFDGNRRIAAIKIALNPAVVNDEKFRNSVKALLASHGEPPNEVECRIETDIEVVEEIIYRRHSGSQGGVGQSQWDPPAKLNFQTRTGKHTRLNIASRVEEVFHEAGLLDDSKNIKRSVFNRLFSAEIYRARAGLKVAANKLLITHQGLAVARALAKILDDLENGDLTLNAVWDESAKFTYLNELEMEGHLPSVEMHLEKPVEFDAHSIVIDQHQTEQEDLPPDSVDQSPEDGDPSPPKEPLIEDNEPDRLTLIPQDKIHQFNWPDDTSRIRRIWRELQFKLELEEHICAISVLERVLIELIVDRYLDVGNISSVKSSDGLAQKIKKLAVYLEQVGEISADYKDALFKLVNGEEIVSINTLNKYVHSAKLNPSPIHVCAIWDTLSELVRVCLKK